MEFDMKDQMIRQSIITTQSDIEEIKKSIEKIEDKIYNRWNQFGKYSVYTH